MAGITAVIVKILPESTTSNLEDIKRKAMTVLEKEGSKNISFEIIEVAFGLKAIMVKFACPEEKGTEIIEKALGKIKEVSSIDIVDYRRAFG